MSIYNNSIYNELNRVEITREQYQQNKNKFEKKVDIVAIPQKINNSWCGYRYYIRKGINI